MLYIKSNILTEEVKEYIGYEQTGGCTIKIKQIAVTHEKVEIKNVARI